MKHFKKHLFLTVRFLSPPLVEILGEKTVRIGSLRIAYSIEFGTFMLIDILFLAITVVSF